MPARDPAATPHLPTVIDTPPPNDPLLPTYLRSTSGDRRRSTHQAAGSTSTSPNVSMDRRVSTGDGVFTKFFRRLSQDAGGAAQFEAQVGVAPDDTVSDTSGFERIDDSMDETASLASSHKSRAIRDSTNRLASMSFSSRAASNMSGPNVTSTGQQSGAATSTSGFADRRVQLSPLTSATPHPDPPVLGSPQSGPSGLSVLLERGRKAAESSNGSETSGEITPQAGGESLVSAFVHGRSAILAEVEEVEEEDLGSSSELRRYLENEQLQARTGPVTETTPLLGGPSTHKSSSWRERTAVDFAAAKNHLSKVTGRDIVQACLIAPLECVPSVILGLLLNVLDGVSYGMILFPVSPFFPDFGSLGVSMFFMSCIVSQLTFSLGGSIFGGGNGSMMIEAVPFFHIIVAQIVARVGDDESNAHVIVATTMMAFAFSSILTGLVFWALGAFKLGALIGYFPRHILVGCIGGVGIFLIVTGFQVALGLGEEGEMTLGSIKLFFASWHAFALWTIPLGLAILLRVITHHFHHQLVFPVYFFVIPIIFYIVVAIGGWSWAYLRENHWVFDVGENIQPWWKFYTYYDFKATNWGVFWSVMPSQLALVFFGILHVPLNVPALGVSLAEDNVKLDRELIAHGISNFASGVFGSVPNYLTYVNSVLFYRVGGGSRLSGVMLAAATALIMFVGPTAIGYLPVMVVAALIYVLGIDLVIESVWDTRHRVNRMEYITIWVIAIGMTVFDFVIGLLIGIILACVFFVVQSSRRRPVRAVFNGSTAKSTVRRPRAQRAFIQKVGHQTYVMKLQGFLFFGTINYVEDEIRKLLDLAQWRQNPIRFLLIDFSLVAGLDFSSAEAFVRIQRLLSAKDVLLILCGADPHSPVGTALRAVDLWADQEGTRVEVFASLNDALEWTENTYLTAFYESHQVRKGGEGETRAPRHIDLPKITRMPFSIAESFQNTPRRSHLVQVGDDILPSTYGPGVASSPPAPAQRRLSNQTTESQVSTRTASQSPARPVRAQPFAIIVQTIGSYCDEKDDFFAQFVPYFKQVIAEAGQVVWRQNDASDGLYIIESGSLRATYEYDEYAHAELVQETMVSGTIAGDLSTLSDTTRNCTCVAERDSVLWKLEPESLRRMEIERPEATNRFLKYVLKAAVEEVDVLSSHLIAALS